MEVKLKRDSTGNITKHKARLAALGDQQEPNSSSVFAPAVRYSSLRVILAIACIHDWGIEQMDVVSAFLHANVESEICMEQPQGYAAYGDKGQPLVSHLKKALYGIREARKTLNELFTTWLIDYGFVPSLVDLSVFTFKHGNPLYTVALCVDNSILVGRKSNFMQTFKAALAKSFEIEDLSPAC